MGEETIAWALLAPSEASWLQSRIDAFRQEKDNNVEASEKWKVKQGVSSYSAVINEQQRIGPRHEVALAKQLSKELSGTVYVLYPPDAYKEADAIYVYKKGRETGTDPDDLYTFASDLGIPLRGEPKKSKSLTTRTVVVVEGVKAGPVAKTLDFKKPPRGPSLTIEDGSRGALVFSSKVGDLTVLADDFTRAFPESNIYILGSGPSPGRFFVRQLRSEKTLGVFELTDSGAVSTSGVPRLTSVNGETTREGIAESLGVSLELLELAK
jgi:hypothetical protein